MYAIQRPDGTIIQEVEDAKTWAWEACARVDKALNEFRTSMNPGWERKAIWRGYRCVEVEVVEAGAFARAAAYKDAVLWALGSPGSDFRARMEGEGPYYWRSELAERAGLRWDSKGYVEVQS